MLNFPLKFEVWKPALLSIFMTWLKNEILWSSRYYNFYAALGTNLQPVGILYLSKIMWRRDKKEILGRR